MAQNRAEFANFLCHFSKDFVFLDYLEAIVLPAFTDDTMIRSRGSENRRDYHFYDVNLDVLDDSGDEPILAISGHFVKDVNLIRTQIYDKDKGLVEDHDSIESSPSSFFLLIINNHKLVFYPETPYAPSIGEFQSTVKRFVFDKYNGFINNRYAALNENTDQTAKGGKITKKRLREENPQPNIQIVSLTNPQSIHDFVLQFEKLVSIDFRILRPNPTFDAEEAFGQLRGVLTDLGADNAKLNTSNNSDGLNKKAAIEVIDQAALGGNQEVSLKGNTFDGASISGNNNDFKATVPINNADGTRRSLVELLYAAMIATVSGSMNSDGHQQKHKNVLSRLAERIKSSMG